MLDDLLNIDKIRHSVFTMITEEQRQTKRPVLVKMDLPQGQNIKVSMIDTKGETIKDFKDFTDFILSVEMATMTPEQKLQLTSSLKLPDIREMVENGMKQGETAAMTKIIEMRVREKQEKAFLVIAISSGVLRYAIFSPSKNGSIGKQVREIKEGEMMTLLGLDYEIEEEGRAIEKQTESPPEDTKEEE